MRTEEHRLLATLRALPALPATTASIYGVSFVLLVVSAVTWQPGRNPRWVLAVLAVVALAFVVWILVRGSRFTAAEALPMVAAHVGIIGCLSWTTDVMLGAFSNGTVLPVVAVYVLWFLHPVAGRVVLYAGLLWWFVAVVHHGATGMVPFAIGLVVQAAIAAEVFVRIKRRMDDLARRDHLTGALNRFGITEVLDRELARSQRRGQPMSVVAADLDGLRAVNNAHGHRAGDELLETIASHWSRNLRRGDALGRIGGDEFLMVLPGTSRLEAEQIVDRLVESSPGPWSAGAAEMKQGDTAQTMLERADQRMYGAKAARQQS